MLVERAHDMMGSLAGVAEEASKNTPGQDRTGDLQRVRLTS